MVEQRIENPCVGGSIPPLATKKPLISGYFLPAVFGSSPAPQIPAMHDTVFAAVGQVSGLTKIRTKRRSRRQYNIVRQGGVTPYRFKFNPL
ncbi:conserved hypothetical protein [Neisseria gonorrhoeae]|nr:conserved hypothetical protein [Neisseria gonorrhoeae]SCW13536.1 conserved hypothetical protein [Neisseria gonorrhoeae]